MSNSSTTTVYNLLQDIILKIKEDKMTQEIVSSLLERMNLDKEHKKYLILDMKKLIGKIEVKEQTLRELKVFMHNVLWKVNNDKENKKNNNSNN